MRRFTLLLLAGAVAAFAVWFVMRGKLAKPSSSAVTSLLPDDTVAFIHLPDLNGSRAKWHETEIYKLWREPALQEFLQRPLSKYSAAGTSSELLEELEPLEMKDAFLAITSWENNYLKMLGGFRFKGSAEEAEKVIGKWRTRMQQNAPSAQGETIPYQQHSIDLMRQDAVTVATAYDGHWFFAANDVAALQALLDRADERVKDPGSTLAQEESFTAAFQHMPLNYAAFAYARVDRYLDRLSKAVPNSASAGEQLGMLRQVRSVAAASSIDNGRFRDVLFLAMPKRQDVGDLTRSSLSLATSDSFLYSAGFLKLPSELPAAAATPPAETTGLLAMFHRAIAALASTGVTMQDWNSAFGPEFGIIGNWAENARLPAFSVSLPVKDLAKAKTIIGALTAATREDETWTRSEKDSVTYFSRPPVSPMVPVAPTLALSDRLLLLGQDPAAAEDAVRRSTAGHSALAESNTYKGAARLVAPPKHAFTYLDMPLLYTRLDAAVRPMLVMAAAFMPRIGETVDLSKLPNAEVITKHLGSVVVSQSYDTDGYMTESAGPISLYPAVIGIGVATGASSTLFRSPPARNLQPGRSPAPAAPPVPPSPTPDEAR